MSYIPMPSVVTFHLRGNRVYLETVAAVLLTDAACAVPAWMACNERPIPVDNREMDRKADGTGLMVLSCGNGFHSLRLF
ncbi:hypothetical protein D3C81_1948160 [compost metagenome]